MAPAIDIEILHEALRRAPSVIGITDADMAFLYVNRVEHGFKLSDVIGTRYGAWMPPDQQPKVKGMQTRAMETGETQSFEIFVDPPAGERRWYTHQLCPYTASDGTRGVIAIMSDVTRRKLAELQVESLRRELVEASHRAGMAEIASGVLHNVGTVLNHANIATEMLAHELERSRLHLLGRVVAMLVSHQGRLAELFTEDPKGRKLPALLTKIFSELDHEQARLRGELSRLREQISLMRSTVEAQQSLARLGEMSEPIRPDVLVRQALSLFQFDLESRSIALESHLDDVGLVVLDKQATLQVLSHVIRNAIEALERVETGRRLAIRLYVDAQKLCFDVEDNGCGIAPEQLGRMFERGFSTKPGGRGFGLHTSAVAARTMNGVLEAHSEGPGRGARIRLMLPRLVP